LPAWGLDSLTNTPALNEATQQLSRALLKQALTQRRNYSWLIGVLLLVLAFPLGGLIAWSQREKPLLVAEPVPATKVKQFETVKEQYAAAMLAQKNREQWLKSVWEYQFPPEKNKAADSLRYARLAKGHLAWLYLQQDRLNESLALYSELANVESTEVEFRLQGLAGEAVVFDRLSRKDDVFERLPTDYTELKDPRLRAEIEALLAKYSAVTD
jgi:hypothetical protein